MNEKGNREAVRLSDISAIPDMQLKLKYSDKIKVDQRAQRSNQKLYYRKENSGDREISTQRTMVLPGMTGSQHRQNENERYQEKKADENITLLR